MSERVVSFGEALVVLHPDAAVSIDQADHLRMAVGGAEVNFAIGIRRLGYGSAWIGRIGDDPLGRRVTRALRDEGVDIDHVRVDPRPTGLYLREWLPDGRRRPYYYRAGSAGSALDFADWPTGIEASWLHLSGVTLALGPRPRRAVERIAAWAVRQGIPVSFDPNYREALWPPDRARDAFRALLPRVDTLLLDTGEADLVFDTSDPEIVLKRALAQGVRRPVIKLGADGAMAVDEDGCIIHRVVPSRVSLDPVGAGDAFDAGFVAGALAGATVAASLELAAYCGARAVEQVGDHAGIPRRHELPRHLKRLLAR